MKPKTVFVGLSGGVDSSVAAHRLLHAGYNVVGVFIKVWHPDFLPCNWEQERRDAMRVAAHLGIPFLTCDAEQAYHDHVAQYFINEYQAGRTPNPDVMCNKFVKFGAFLEFADQYGADYIATGHYARVTYDTGTERYNLLRGQDENKDQTYFLWTLTQDQLARTLFPIGDTPKDQIRTEADKAGLPTAIKKDSQGICFLGQVDVPEFLAHFIDLSSGEVVDERGTVIGDHKGAAVYTPGQRHGFNITDPTLASTPFYVQYIDIHTNTITVAAEPPQVAEASVISIEQINCIAPIAPGQVLSLQTRYRQTPLQACVLEISDRQAHIKLDVPTQQWARGQSCVLYSGDHCLGGGIIQ